MQYRLYHRSEIPVETTAHVHYSASDCVGQDYLTIKNDFSIAGFYNIKVEEIEDLKFSETDNTNLHLNYGHTSII